jgi:hypothetical protein
LFKPAQKGHPTQEEIDQAHEEFMIALTSLFDQHKVALGYAERELIIM